MHYETIRVTISYMENLRLTLFGSPRLERDGKIVEMDESFFPGCPKFNRGRRLGEDSWDDDEKWIFALTERGSLDAKAIQVPSNRSRKVLLPHINHHCLPGSIFCSDGWKAYYKLVDHLDIEDTLLSSQS